MKIAIFGATGGTGKELVKQALEQGHEITALVRNPEKLSINNKKLKIIKGDVLNEDDVSKAIQGSDAVLVALGVKPLSKAKVVGPGTKNIIEAMKAHNAKRLIVESAMFMDDAVRKNSFLISLLTKTFMKGLYADKLVQESAIRKSGLKWVIVRPVGLANGPKTETYRFGESLELKGLFPMIARADVADFMLKQLRSDVNLHKMVLIAN
ncbi:MAG: NAD-dependent epimerase/dehydratase [archaeon GW2011_AR20]|nr:MAG: NAD-dependent epimerase/dehydratase [archaeon GW2011_AR20]MBS3160949.1 SDR family oxidoreductase [Candidatus Woesearchaeota archaeon]